ncbi:hypothetical protein ACOMHN_030619 [Nucella lapillus]
MHTCSIVLDFGCQFLRHNFGAEILDFGGKLWLLGNGKWTSQLFGLEAVTGKQPVAGTHATSNLTIGQALERCLSRAVATQRVTVGIQECAKLLGCAPERVLLCVIPDMSASADVGLHIQHTLVRSFCWENDLRLLTVSH